MRRPLHLLALLALALAPLASARAEPPAAAPPPVRVFVDDVGYYRVRAAALRKAGFHDDMHVQASLRGHPLPVLHSRVGDDVVFLSWAEEADRPGRHAVLLTPGASAPHPPGPPPPLPESGVEPELRAPDVVRLGPRGALYGALAAAESGVYATAAPTWFVARLGPGESWTLPGDPTALPGSHQALEVMTWLTAPGTAGLRGTHGDQGRASIDPGQKKRLTFGAIDPQRPTMLENATRLGEPTPNDVTEGRGTLWIESYTWEGAIRLLPKERFAYWWARPGKEGGRAWYPLTVGVGDDVFALRVQPQDNANLGPPAIAQDPGHPERRLFWDGPAVSRDVVAIIASSGVIDVEPEGRPAAADPIAAARGAEHVIVATKATLPGARRLAEHRTKTGLKSVAIAAQDVYEALSDGEQDPEVLRAFLRKLREDSGGRTPKYVLLAGDAVRDRTDLVDFETIPALMARTQYNGATPADSLYVEGDDAHGVGEPVVGRLPFRDAATMDAFVDRLIAYETHPPLDASRRTLRFLANEARFGPAVDSLIEMFFRRIVTEAVPPDYDVEVTFASPKSSFFWPPRDFNRKVIEGLDDGALFYTYVGHGFEQGFDSLHVGDQRYPVLHLKDVPKVDVKGTPPVVFAIACTTAEFDDPDSEGLGEALLARPHGPIAFYGATRICHPAANAFLGRGLARAMFPPQGAPRSRRLGEVLAQARDSVLDPTRDRSPEVALMTLAVGSMLPPGTGVDLKRLQREAFWLYNLLGDPGTLLPLPEPLAGLDAAAGPAGITASVSGLPDGASVTFTLEVPRAHANPVHPLAEGLDPTDPKNAEALRANHDHANDKVVAHASAKAAGGRAQAMLSVANNVKPLSDPAYGGHFVVKAWVESGGRVLLGAKEVEVSVAAAPGR